MIHLKTYKLFEAHGVAEATLIYNQLLLNDFNKHFDIALESGDKNYSSTQEYTQDDLAEFIKDENWSKYPVSSMSVTYTIKTISDEEWNNKFPTSTKKFVGTGACYNIGEEGGSALKPAINDKSDATIHLVLEIGAIVSDVFNDRDGLSIEIESAITHELNHGYEGWNRMKKGKGQVSTDVTWALDVNRAKIKKDIWKVWYDEIGYYVYWSELHEMNAMTQDAWPYVRRYDVTEMKEKTPSWKFSTRMKEFNADKFKQKMVDKILSIYPDADVDMMLKRIKNGFANDLIEKRKESIEKNEDKPTIAGEAVRAMSVDRFLSFIQKRINRAGSKLQRNILDLYALKNKY